VTYAPTWNYLQKNNPFKQTPKVVVALLNNITITVYNKQTAETQAAKMLNISIINA